MKQKISTAKKMWESYRAEIIPANAPPVQIQECRRAFYAGIVAMNEIYLRIGEPDISEEVGMLMISAVQRELQIFGENIGTEREGE